MYHLHGCHHWCGLYPKVKSPELGDFFSKIYVTIEPYSEVSYAIY